MDVNSLFNQASLMAQQRRSAASGVLNQLVSSDTVKATDMGYSDISVEDIANAMKARNAVKDQDNKFIEKSSGVKKVDKEDNVSSVDASLERFKVHNAVNSTNQQIERVDRHSQILLERQDAVANNIRSVQKNPYIQ